MSNLLDLPQPPEIIAALRAAGCGILRRPIIAPEQSVEKQPNQYTLPRAPRVIDVKTIRSVVAAVCQISVPELISEKRFTPTCRARQIFYYAARELTGASLPQIGKLCGDRDHSTVNHGIQKVTANRDAFEPELTMVLNYMKRRG